MGHWMANLGWVPVRLQAQDWGLGPELKLTQAVERLSVAQGVGLAQGGRLKRGVEPPDWDLLILKLR